ncbi:MAG: response regulator [Candidatus Paceibacterota bacterium]
MARIIICDDSISFCEMMKDMLLKCSNKRYESSFELKVDGAHSAVEFFDMIKSRNYELVILDIILARDDGWAILSEIRKDKSKSDLPVIVVSAVDSVDLKYESIRKGAVDGFAKPLRGEELKRFVDVVFNLVVDR